MKRILAIFFALIFLSLNCSDYTEDLGNGYEYGFEGAIVRTISGGKINIDVDVIAYAYNDDFIIAAQMPYSYEKVVKEEKCGESYKYDTVYFYIIDKRIDSLYGPMGLQEYLDTRNRMGLPKDFRMEVKL
jgi:hypothetical protein